MTTKSERIEVRLSPEHRALIEEAAAQRGQSVSAFVVAEAIEGARRLQATLLTRRDWERFVALMDTDEAPTPALRAAAKKARRRR
jgi:uncharacterized protein (DUF1778 family)